MKVNNFNFIITVNGGGFSGQADAIRLGIARALLEFNIELKSILRKQLLVLLLGIRTFTSKTIGGVTKLITFVFIFVTALQI